MAVLTITGNIENLKKLRKLNRGFASRRGLKMVLTEEKQEESKTPLADPKPKVKTTSEIIKLIQACETIEALEAFEKDDRKEVVKAFGDKLEILSGDKKPEKKGFLDRLKG